MADEPDKSSSQPYRLGVGGDPGVPPKRGFSATPGLVPVEGSLTPANPMTGEQHPHVHGPQQAPADPVAAGLDTEYVAPVNAAPASPVGAGPHRAFTLGGETTPTAPPPPPASPAKAIPTEKVR